MKWREILALILAILLILLIVFVLAGWKDETGVLTWSITHEDPPKAVWYYDGEKTFRYTLDEETDVNEPEKCEHVIIAYSDSEALYCLYCGKLEVESTPDTLNLNAVIPTWPDYIELEKDLWIKTNKDSIFLNKGTKIYFKEDKK